MPRAINPKYYLKHIGNFYVSCLEMIEMLTKEIKDPIEESFLTYKSKHFIPPSPI